MNPLQRAVIEKVGREYGFEHVLPDERDIVCLGSARHRAQVCIAQPSDLFEIVFFSTVAGQLSAELARSFPGVERIHVLCAVQNATVQFHEDWSDSFRSPAFQCGFAEIPAIG